MASQNFNDSRIDRSVGLLLLGMLVFGFFLIAILGMQNVQKQAKSMANFPSQETTEQPVYDFPNNVTNQ